MSLSTENPLEDPPVFKATYSYSLNLKLSAGFNHIAWSGHAPILYQQIAHNPSNSKIHLAFPGEKDSSLHQFSLSDDEVTYLPVEKAYPVLYAMGTGNIPLHVSLYQLGKKTPSLQQLSIMGIGTSQFERDLSLQLRDLHRAYGPYQLEGNLSPQLQTLHALVNKDDGIPYNFRTDRVVVPEAYGEHTRHLIALCLPN